VFYGEKKVKKPKEKKADHASSSTRREEVKVAS
jgi:hypothetical protein